MKRVVLSVTNDLYTDPRVDKVSHSLEGMGCEVLLVGRRYADSPALPSRSYRTRRMRLLFRKGPVFYAEYQLRLFLFLLFVRCDILVANDLDTLLPNVLVSRLRRKPLVYDSHEYFCQVLEVVTRPRVQRAWHRIERFCFPKADRVITVSESIAVAYRREYDRQVEVVRNVPLRRMSGPVPSRPDLGLPEGKTIIILQGNAIHRERGGELMVETMPLLPESVILLVVGAGDALPLMRRRVEELGLGGRVLFAGRVAPERMAAYTACADIGVSFDRSVCLNHDYSLPNKIFEYIQAGIPILVSDLPERRRLLEQYGVGLVVEMEPQAVAAAVRRMTDDAGFYSQCRAKCREAAEILCWEREEERLRQIYKPFIENENNVIDR
ncbi:MAG: glycosyltransferase [Bacteroidales bacterium]|nr:glycosyltransferase [Bacteroidales bacterium]